MSKFTRTFITIETVNAEFLTARIIFADQMQYEKTSRARGWNPEKDQALSNLFMAWQSLLRTGQHDLSWEDFQEFAIDTQVETKDIDTETGEEITAAGDPTQ